MQRYPMTPQGHAALEAELKQLKTVERPRITAAIAEAREHGDLKEMPNTMPLGNSKGCPKHVFVTSKQNLAGLRSLTQPPYLKTDVWCLV